MRRNELLFKSIKKNNCKGALTVEASLTFPVFVCLFLFLIFFIKIASINIILDNAVVETAKQLATSCYPIAYLNELEDDYIPNDVDVQSILIEEFKDMGNTVLDDNSNVYSETLAKIISGNASVDDFKNLIGQFGENLLERGLDWFAAREISKVYFDIKHKAEYLAASSLMKNHIANTWLSPDQLEITFISFPSSVSELELRQNSGLYLAKCSQIGYIPGQDEVVIVVEYKTGLSIPFFPAKEIVIRKWAVEKAWLNGSYGVYAIHSLTADESQGGDNENNNENSGENNVYENEYDVKGEEYFDEEYKGNQKIYKTKTGTRYHMEGCMYLRMSKIPITISQAEKEGLKPCKICIQGMKPFGR